MKVREMFVDFNTDYTNAEFVECQKNYRGYKEYDELNEWLSKIFDEEVFMIRAQDDRLMPVSDYLPDQLKNDRRMAFVTDAAIHIINK